MIPEVQFSLYRLTFYNFHRRMYDIQSERRILDEPDAFINPDPLLGRPNHRESVYIEARQFKRTLHLPIYLYGYMTELIKVNVTQEDMKGRFTIYVTIPLHLTIEHMRIIKSQQLQLVETETHCQFLRKELKQLKNFIRNNLIMECGSKIIDVIFDQSKKGDSTLDSSDEETDEEDEEEEEEPDDYICQQIKIKKYQNDVVTFRVQGVFKCDYTLDSIFFPYLSLDAALRIRVRSQYFSNCRIQYHIIPFQFEETHGVKQFSFKFMESKDQKFGIYQVDSQVQNNSLSFISRNIINIDDYGQEGRLSMEEVTSVTRYVQFQFQVFSFNLPFILRNLVPQFVLCFTSILCYFAGAGSIWDIYGNVILLMITLIQILSNFSRSNFSTSSFNLFQANLFGIIIINVFLPIIETFNYYDQDVDIDTVNINSKNAFFWISVGIGSFLALSNAVMLTYFGIKAGKSSENFHSLSTKRLHNQIVWNEEWYEEYFLEVILNRDRQTFLRDRN